jgi:hypothetical protein
MPEERRGEDVVYVLEEARVLYLRVVEEKHHLLILAAGGGVELLYILAELEQAGGNSSLFRCGRSSCPR